MEKNSPSLRLLQIRRILSDIPWPVVVVFMKGGFHYTQDSDKNATMVYLTVGLLIDSNKFIVRGVIRWLKE